MRKLTILSYIIICITTSGCAGLRTIPCYEPNPDNFKIIPTEAVQKLEFAQCRRYPTQRQIAACMFLRGYQLGRCTLDESWHPEGTVRLQ